MTLLWRRYSSDVLDASRVPVVVGTPNCLLVSDFHLRSFCCLRPFSSVVGIPIVSGIEAAFPTAAVVPAIV